jgi:hypothetical protein
MVIIPQGRQAHWPADYRAYAVELHQQYDAGIITKQEAQVRLAERFPGYELPDERTWRRWAHERYSDLPERRRQFLGPQGLDWVPTYSSAPASFPGVQTSPQVIPVQSVLSSVAIDLINWMAACFMVAIGGAMIRKVLSSL